MAEPSRDSILYNSSDSNDDDEQMKKSMRNKRKIWLQEDENSQYFDQSNDDKTKKPRIFYDNKLDILGNIDLEKQTSQDEDIREIRRLYEQGSPFDIYFAVDQMMIPSYQKVLLLFAKQRLLIKRLLQNEKIRNGNMNEFSMAGTTPEAFNALLHYIYTGKLVLQEVDKLTNGTKRNWKTICFDLAETAMKLRFQELHSTLAQRLMEMIILDNENQRESFEYASDLYWLTKQTKNEKMKHKYAQVLDQLDIQHKTIDLKIITEYNKEPFKDVVTIVLDKPRVINYIEFMVSFRYNDGSHYPCLNPVQVKDELIQSCSEPSKCKFDLCFRLWISKDSQNWKQIIDNESIYNSSWQWFYFLEQKVKKIKIENTSPPTNGISLCERFKYLLPHFRCKRKNIELNFDPQTGYLIPKHNVIEYPKSEYPYYFAGDEYTLCLSQAKRMDKIKHYIYHNINDGFKIEFYLPQTCLIDNFRFHLFYSHDQRNYDYKVHIRNENDTEDEYTLICEMKEKSHWQNVKFEKLLPVRWISITGTRSSVEDQEFAITHFECPSQKTYYSHSEDHNTEKEDLQSNKPNKKTKKRKKKAAN